MASYKVAQDVEAEDKLLGPFSFRQFIYLVVAALAGIIAYGLSRVFTPLFIVPTPIIIFFLILALPLRKDQPTEVYLAAIVSFYLKPRRRLWQPDGIESLIEITVPHTEERQLTKAISGSEAERRLSYLATLADTHGWSIRNVSAPDPTNTSMVGDVYNEAQSYQDVFDESGAVARSFESMIDRADETRRQNVIDRMHQPSAPKPVQPQPTPPAATLPQPNSTAEPAAPEPQLKFNPYPTNIHQRVIAPAGNAPPPQSAAPAPAAATPKPDQSNTSDNTPSPDIINLASNKDLSIETIAREAHRIEEKHRDDEQEVVISLR